MPVWVDVLNAGGLGGPDLQQPPLSWVFWFAVTLLASIGGLCLVGALGVGIRHLKAWREHDQDKFRTFIFSLSLCCVYFGPILFVSLRMDHHLLPMIPGFMAAIERAVARVIPGWVRTASWWQTRSAHVKWP
jgi:hypothetical protein